jgi:hypothetical protein
MTSGSHQATSCMYVIRRIMLISKDYVDFPLAESSQSKHLCWVSLRCRCSWLQTRPTQLQEYVQQHSRIDTHFDHHESVSLAIIWPPRWMSDWDLYSLLGKFKSSGCSSLLSNILLRRRFVRRETLRVSSPLWSSPKPKIQKVGVYSYSLGT